MKLSVLLREFFESQKAGGLVLLFCTILSLILANSSLQAPYLEIWNVHVAGHDLTHWINDGLMAIFFLLIGLELEREVYAGELSSLKNAMLPVFAAIGGMLLPAGIHVFINHGLDSQAGAGIPMATDIAFAIGILSLLGNRVPASLKLFLTALAVIDDLGAILTIAVFYTSAISWFHLGIAMGIFGALLLLNRLRVHNLIPYLIGGAVMWYFMLHSGIHATITGVLVAFAIPFGDGSQTSPSYRLQHYLHVPVAFVILPLFALANTCLVIEPGFAADLLEPNALGIIAGLVLGKPVGILLLSIVAVACRLSVLPAGVSWKHIAAVACLGGIGFTMSIFISMLAFDQPHFINGSKMAVLIASATAALIGLLLLVVVLPKQTIAEEAA